MAQNCDAAVGLGHLGYGPAIQSFSQPVALALSHPVGLLFIYLLQLAYCFITTILNFSVTVVPQRRKEVRKGVRKYMYEYLEDIVNMCVVRGVLLWRVFSQQ